MNTEADTCRKYIVPKLQSAGWDDAPCAIQEQRTFTDGRVLFVGGVARRGTRKRADYILRYRPDYPIAGARGAGVRFAYASNGRDIIEIDLALGTEVQRGDFPTPGELWSRLETQLEISGAASAQLLSPGFPRS